MTDRPEDEQDGGTPRDPTSPSRRIPYPDVPPPSEAPDPAARAAARGPRRTVVIGESEAAPGSGVQYPNEYTSLTERIVAATSRTGSVSRSRTTMVGRRDATGVIGEPGLVGESGATSAPSSLDDPAPTAGTGLSGRVVTAPLAEEGNGADTVRDGTSRVVVISDHDGLPDASYTVADSRSPDAPGGPRVHPRLRARRLAIRRKAGRRRIYWSAVAGGLLLIAVVAIGILSTPLFAVNTIRLSGIVYTDQEDIAEITKSIRGKPILTADLNSARDRLEALPWVKYASVTMDFPHTVVIQIAERTPVATFLGEDNKWRVIDVEGRVIDVLAGRPVDYMAIYGAGPLLEPGANSPEFAQVAQLVSSTPPALVPLVRHFEVDQQFNVSLTLRINKKGDTLVDLCSAETLDIRQMVALAAFLKTKVDPKATPPGRITACKPDLVTTSDS